MGRAEGLSESCDIPTASSLYSTEIRKCDIRKTPVIKTRHKVIFGINIHASFDVVKIRISVDVVRHSP